MEQARIEHTPNRSLLTYITSADALVNYGVHLGTVLPAKSDRDFMFCLQSYQGLIIDRSIVY